MPLAILNNVPNLEFFKNLLCSRSLEKLCLSFLACSGCRQHHKACNFRRLVAKSLNSWGPSINYVVERGEGQKLPILLGKKTTKRREGVKNC